MSGRFLVVAEHLGVPVYVDHELEESEGALGVDSQDDA